MKILFCMKQNFRKPLYFQHFYRVFNGGIGSDATNLRALSDLHFQFNSTPFPYLLCNHLVRDKRKLEP